MSAVVVTAVFTPLPDKHSELVEALSRSLAAVHEEKGCLLYALHSAQDERIVMIEKWASQADLDAHGDSAATRALRAAVADLLAAPAVVESLQPIPAGAPEQGAL